MISVSITFPIINHLKMQQFLTKSSTFLFCNSSVNIKKPHHCQEFIVGFSFAVIICVKNIHVYANLGKQAVKTEVTVNCLFK